MPRTTRSLNRPVIVRYFEPVRSRCPPRPNASSTHRLFLVRRARESGRHVRSQNVIFTQGDPADSVMYLRSGGIQLSVLSHAGREAVVATMRPGDFLGEGALSGQPVRLATARATMASTVLVVPAQR